MLMVKQIIFITALFYILLLLFLFFQQKKFIFFPTQTKHASPPGGKEFLFSHDNVNLHGWILQERYAQDRLIIYYGGNAEDIYYAAEQFEEFGDTAALLVNYRGYGASTGSPGEEELFSDALAVFDEVNKLYTPDKIFLMGRSLGSGVACYVAAQKPVAGIILITPFDSIASIAKRQFPYLPIDMVLQHKFLSIDFVENFNAPSLVIYGGRDTTVLPSQTQKLIDRIHGEPTVVYIEAAEHNNIELFDEYNLAILTFIQ
jgi:pimeloyl-ACP methyl ester carboxylesterase